MAPGSKVIPTPVHLEHLLVLLHQRVLGLGEDAHQGALVQVVQRHRHGKAAHQLRDEAEAQQVLRLHLVEEVAGADPLHVVHAAEADLPLPRARLDDLLQPVERAAADEEDVARVDLDVLLLRMLAPTLRRHRSGGPLQDLEERLLHPLAETSRVIDGFSLLRAILSISSM
jgi:hypothetical protein